MKAATQVFSQHTRKHTQRDRTQTRRGGCALLRRCRGRSVDGSTDWRERVQLYRYQEAQPHQLAVVDAVLAKIKILGKLQL